MSCSNCFNGCVQTTSDQCVKYTGPDISQLGIETGHPLSSILSDIITKLVETFSGTTILPTLDPTALCTLITDELPANPTLIDVLEAITKTICSLNSDKEDLEQAVAAIEADYTVDCLPGVLPDAGTHTILQTVITALCDVITDVSNLNTSLSDYVKISDLTTYIQNYLSSQNTNYHYLKMVPYTVVEYYGTLSPFNATGAGTGLWEKIYLCNGENGTPDKRGRIPIGATSMGSSTFDPVVEPGLNGNIAYNLNTTNGSNRHTLSTNEIPSHTHSVNTVVNESPHTHVLNGSDKGGDHGHYIRERVSSGAMDPQNTGVMSSAAITSAKTNITVSVTAANTGGGSPHNNVPPVRACYYIMYIP